MQIQRTVKRAKWCLSHLVVLSAIFFENYLIALYLIGDTRVPSTHHIALHNNFQTRRTRGLFNFKPLLLCRYKLSPLNFSPVDLESPSTKVTAFFVTS